MDPKVEETENKPKKKSKKNSEDPEPAEAKDADDNSGGDATHEEKRASRSSNVFAMFSQNQIQEFKEAFTMLDQNRDGIIDEEDLRATFQSLGREPKSQDLKEMLKEARGPLNFTLFLSLFGEKMHGTDSEDAIRTSFEMFDPEKKGYLHEEYLKDLLTNTGDQFTDQELKAMWKEAPVDGGNFNYHKYTILIKRGKEDDM